MTLWHFRKADENSEVEKNSTHQGEGEGVRRASLLSILYSVAHCTNVTYDYDKILAIRLVYKTEFCCILTSQSLKMLRLASALLVLAIVAQPRNLRATNLKYRDQ